MKNPLISQVNETVNFVKNDSSSKNIPTVGHGTVEAERNSSDNSSSNGMGSMSSRSMSSSGKTSPEALQRGLCLKYHESGYIVSDKCDPLDASQWFKIGEN